MSKPGLESKVIVLGLSQSGKTSIRQVIFEGFAPDSTALNPATVRINRKLFNLAGGGINLFDIGGQTSYLNEVFDQYKERTFTNVKAAIFVVDISDAANIMRSKYYFDLTLKNLALLSKKSRIYIFAHKMDVVQLNKRKVMVESIGEIFETENYDNVSIFGTSIFDQTIWDAMQKVLSFVYPRDDSKTKGIKDIVGKFSLEFLALSTSQGLVLYSEPEVDTGVNYSRLKNEITKAYFPTSFLNQAIFTIGEFNAFMKELDDDLVVTTVFPSDQTVPKSQESFTQLCEQIKTLFKPDELLGRAKVKMRKALEDHLKKNGLKNVHELDRKLDAKISIKCDVCGKQIQKSLLDVALENSEQLERGLKISIGFGISTVEMYPLHDCIEGIREIPVILDGNLEYRRYDKSRPI